MLDTIVDAIEEYLCAVYQRRVLQAIKLRAELVRHNWNCREIPGNLHLHIAEKPHKTNPLPSRLLSCCSFEDRIFIPAVRRYIGDIQALIEASHHFHQHLYFYRGSSYSYRCLRIFTQTSFQRRRQ